MELKFETTMQENDALKKQVETFSCMEESLRLIESEKNQLKADMVNYSFILYLIVELVIPVRYWKN